MTISRETVEIQARHGRYSFGRHLLLDTVGLGGSRPSLVAVQSGPSGRSEVCAAEFHCQFSQTLEFLAHLDRERGQEAYEWIVGQLLRQGFVKIEEPSAYWYSFRAWRPFATWAELGKAAISTSLDKLCGEYPAHPHAHGLRAFHYLQTGNARQAVLESSEAVIQRPLYAFGWWVLGEAAADYSEDKRNEPEEVVAYKARALNAYKNAVKLDGDNKDYRESKADYLEELGKDREAREERRRIARMK